MLFTFYLKNGIVYLPTSARTDAGAYLNIDPVEVVPVDNSDSLHAAIVTVIKRNNPRIPHPARNAFPKPVVPKYAGVKTWRAFERNTQCWRITGHDGVFTVTPLQADPEGGWRVDRSMGVSLPSETTVDDVARYVVARLQEQQAETGKVN